MQHQTAVPESPSRSANGLFADETVLRPQTVVRELVLVEYVAEPAVKLVVLVLDHTQHAILDPERVEVIDAKVESFDFDLPILEVFAVEKFDPLSGRG